MAIVGRHLPAYRQNGGGAGGEADRGYQMKATSFIPGRIRKPFNSGCAVYFFTENQIPMKKTTHPNRSNIVCFLMEDGKYAGKRGAVT